MADAALLRAFKRLQRTPFTDQDMKLIGEEVRGASDRAMALIYAAMLDTVIEGCLKQRMIELSSTESEQLFRGLAPLSSFSAKINVSYAFRVFGAKTKRELNFIREIRNGFAHAQRSLRFSTKELSELCAALYFPDNILVALPNPNPAFSEPISFPHTASRSDPRSRYEIACQTIALNLDLFDLHGFDSVHRARYLP
jgi:hypothetical protein